MFTEPRITIFSYLQTILAECEILQDSPLSNSVGLRCLVLLSSAISAQAVNVSRSQFISSQCPLTKISVGNKQWVDVYDSRNYEIYVAKGFYVEATNTTTNAGTHESTYTFGPLPVSKLIALSEMITGEPKVNPLSWLTWRCVWWLDLFFFRQIK